MFTGIKSNKKINMAKVKTDRPEDGKIVEASRTRSGSVFFLIKWKHSKDVEKIESKIARIKYPQIVIKFYESIIIFAKSEN